MNKLFLLNLLVFLWISAWAQDPKDLLLDDNEISGWKIFAQTTCHNGDAANEQQLYDVIDGGAELYLDRGWVSGAYRGYSDADDVEMCVEIYDQGSRQYALAVYEEDGSSGEFEYPGGFKDSCRIDSDFLYNYELEMIMNKFFIRLVCKKTEAYKEIMLEFARKIVEKVPIINHGSQVKNNNFKVKILNNNGIYTFHFQITKNPVEALSSSMLAIYNSKGSLIHKLKLEKHNKNSYLATWNSNQYQNQIAPGIYSISLQNKTYKVTKNFLVK